MFSAEKHHINVHVQAILQDIYNSNFYMVFLHTLFILSQCTLIQPS